MVGTPDKSVAIRPALPRSAYGPFPGPRPPPREPVDLADPCLDLGVQLIGCRHGEGVSEPAGNDFLNLRARRGESSVSRSASGPTTSPSLSPCDRRGPRRTCGRALQIRGRAPYRTVPATCRVSGRFPHPVPVAEKARSASTNRL